MRAAAVCLARSEGGRGSGGRGGGSGRSRDQSGLRALAGCPVGVEYLPGLKSTTANPRSVQFNVFARLEVPLLPSGAGWALGETRVVGQALLHAPAPPTSAGSTAVQQQIPQSEAPLTLPLSSSALL
jgi:hypothetical protein